MTCLRSWVARSLRFWASFGSGVAYVVADTIDIDWGARLEADRIADFHQRAEAGLVRDDSDVVRRRLERLTRIDARWDGDWADEDKRSNGIGPVCKYCNRLIDLHPNDHAATCPVPGGER